MDTYSAIVLTTVLICASNMIFFHLGAKFCSKVKVIQIKENQTVEIYDSTKHEPELDDIDDAVEFMTNAEEMDNYNRIMSKSKNRYGDDTYDV